MEKAHSIRDVDTMHSECGIWLVKVPKYLSDTWENADTDTVGKLRIKAPVTGEKKADVTFSLSDHITTSGEGHIVPKEHKFVISSASASSSHMLHVLSQEETMPDPEPGVVQQPYERLSLEGRVIKRAECRPTGDQSYMDLKKQKISQTSIGRKTVQQLSNLPNNYKPISRHQHDIQAEKQKKEQGKKSRLDREGVEAMLFKAFEKHQYYNIKDLQKITQQPITYLKEILNDICIYNMKAPHRNMWELKSEYRHYKETDDDNDGKS